MNVTNDCECNEDEKTSTTCTAPCAESNRLREARRQELKSKLAKVQDKRGEDGDVDSEDSITSFGTDDLEYLMSLEELMAIEHQTRHQLKELKRWEQAYMKILQSTGKVQPKEKNNELEELRGQLEAKSLANQQLAGHISELENQVESLKGKLLHCNEQVAKLTQEQRDDASKLAEQVVADDVDRQIKGIDGKEPNVEDKQVVDKPIILDAPSDSNQDQADTQDVASNAVVPTASKNIQAKAESTDRAVQKPPLSVISKWSDEPEMMEDVERLIHFGQNQSSEAPDAQQMESFTEDSATVYQPYKEKVLELDETCENNASLEDHIPEDSQQDEEQLNLFRQGDIYDQMSIKEFREVSKIEDSNFEESEDEEMKRKMEKKSPSHAKIAAGRSDLVELNKQELEKWLRNIFDVLLTIMICQTCSVMKGKLKEVCEAICYKLGIELPNDDGKDEKANAIGMSELIEYQIQDVEGAVGVIEKEIPGIGNHSEKLLTDQIDSTHPIRTHSLIKKASELAKLQLLEKPIDSTIGTSVPSRSEPLKTHSKVTTTGEEFIDPLPEISSLDSPVGTSTPIRKKVVEISSLDSPIGASTPIRKKMEEIRSESLEKSLNLSRQPLEPIKNQETLSESPTRYPEPDKTLDLTQPDYKLMGSTNSETKIDTNKSVELPRVLSDSQAKISSDPSHHIDLANSGAGRISTTTPDAKGIIKGEGEAKEYEDLSKRPSGISQNIQNLKTKSKLRMDLSESTQALGNKNTGKDVEQKIDDNKEEKKIKKDRDKEMRKKDDDGKDESGSIGEIIRGKEKMQFPKKKNSTHDKEPITPRQSTSNSQEITKSSFIIPKTPYCICGNLRNMMTLTRSQYEHICAAEGRRDYLAEPSSFRDGKTDLDQKAKQGQQQQQQELLPATIPSTKTQTHRQPRSISRYHPDFSCKPCDCDPCGSGNESHAINVKNLVNSLKNLPTIPDTKSQAVLAKIHTLKR